MTKEVFEKFLQRLYKEQREVEAQMEILGKNISIPSDAIAKALKLSSQIATVWDSGNIDFIEKLQKLIFPQELSMTGNSGHFEPI